MSPFALRRLRVERNARSASSTSASPFLLPQKPMVLPPAFYDRAAELLAAHDRDGTLVTQSLQTNATLVDGDWGERLRANLKRFADLFGN